MLGLLQCCLLGKVKLNSTKMNSEGEVSPFVSYAEHIEGLQCSERAAFQKKNVVELRCCKPNDLDLVD